MTSIMEVIRPTDLDELLPLLSDPLRNTRILAGGTDLLMKYRAQSGSDISIVDITGIASLGEIVETTGGLRIGATTSLTAIIGSEIVAERFPVLIEGARAVAGTQIRNLATIGGNVCNASPSADTITPLLVLDAEALICSSDGHRTVPLVDFFVGPGKTVLESGEMLEALLLPWPRRGSEATFTKLSPRAAMDLAVVGVAVALSRDDAGFTAKIGLGAVAPIPLRATEAEDSLAGAITIGPDSAAAAGRLAAAAASPISDLRGSAGYRTKMVERLVARLLLEVQERMTMEAQG